MSASTKTAPVIAEPKVDQTPKTKAHRPWLQFPKNKAGDHIMGKDGLTPADFPWLFDTATGVFRHANVNMVGVQDKMTGIWSKPKPAGPINTEGGKPIFEYAQVVEACNESERSNTPLKTVCLRMLDPLTTNVLQRRMVVAAPAVYIAPDNEVANRKKLDAELDAEIDEALGLTA